MKRFLAMFLAVFGLFSGLGCVGIQETRPQPITVLAYNIHHGAGTDGRLDLERIANIIKSSKADLIALQEVDQKTTRTGGIDQAAELARLTGLHHVFGKAMDYQGGAYGQAILSKWPIKKHEVHQLPQRAGREPRIALSATIDGPIPDLLFVSTHIEHQLEAIRVEQATALNQLFPTNRPTILLGDFNAVPTAPPISILTNQWRDAARDSPAPTVPAGQPTRRIDYILFAPQNFWQVMSTRVLDEPIASDHRPVLALLRENR